MLYVMPSPPSLSVSLRLGHPSPGVLSHLPTPQSRKPVLTCWLTLAETPLLLPRQYQHLLHSQPLGVSGTWHETLSTTFVSITQGIHSLGVTKFHLALVLFTRMNVMGSLGSNGYSRHYVWELGAPSTFF